MRNELFGVFADRSTFERLCSPQRFNRVVESEHATVGVRDLGYGLPNRSVAYESDAGACVVWGEVISETGESPAKRLLERFDAVGRDAFTELNGSYLAFVDCGGDAVLATDPLRSWECYYADTPHGRTFGTDAASVAGTVEETTLDGRSIAEMTHFGLAFDDGTPFHGLHRVPFDGYLEPEDDGELRRFVYDPRPPAEFDYVEELADRLRRAIRRRIDLPGRTGILLSGGYDSRTILSQHPGMDVGYTVGYPGSDEVTVAKDVAAQYGVDHETLAVTSRYLDLRPEVIQYTQGLRESLHIHHRGNNDEIGADSIYHGMLFDTLFRGFFLPRRGIDAFGRTFPLKGLEEDPDVPRYYAEKLGCLGEDDAYAGCGFLTAGSAEEFARDVIEPRFEKCYERADRLHNALDLVGIKQKPTLASRTHLADHYVESFVAADRELIDWHLKTPPEYRNDRTWLRAIGRLDDGVLRHDPPDRPHRSFRLNEIERFVRQKLPGVQEFETPWPDRRELYERQDLDRKLFPGYEEVHSLPPRVKLRMNDLTTWIEFATGESQCTPDELLCPPTGGERLPTRADGGR